MQTRRVFPRCLVFVVLGLSGVGAQANGAQAEIGFSTFSIADNISAGSAASVWKIQVTQIDNNGAASGRPQNVTCPREGCQVPLNIVVAGKPRLFNAIITFVKSGAYLGLQATAPELGKVIDFEKGFDGPIFMALRGPSRDSTTLNFILTGAATTQSGQNAPALMQNSQSLIFHRKLQPDITLKIDFMPPGPVS